MCRPAARWCYVLHLLLLVMSCLCLLRSFLDASILAVGVPLPPSPRAFDAVIVWRLKRHVLFRLFYYVCLASQLRATRRLAHVRLFPLPEDLQRRLWVRAIAVSRLDIPLLRSAVGGGGVRRRNSVNLGSVARAPSVRHGWCTSLRTAFQRSMLQPAATTTAVLCAGYNCSASHLTGFPPGDVGARTAYQCSHSGELSCVPGGWTLRRGGAALAVGGACHRTRSAAKYDCTAVGLCPPSVLCLSYGSLADDAVFAGDCTCFFCCHPSSSPASESVDGAAASGVFARVASQ